MFILNVRSLCLSFLLFWPVTAISGVFDKAGSNCLEMINYEVKATKEAVTMCKLPVNASLEGAVEKDKLIRYFIEIPEGTLTSIEATLQNADNEFLTMSIGLYRNGQLVASAGRGPMFPGPTWIKDFATNNAAAGVLGGPGGTSIVVTLKVSNDADFELRVHSFGWVDSYSTSNQPAFLNIMSQFPVPSFQDSFLKIADGGFSFDSVSNYRWIHIRLLGLLRSAVWNVANSFPGTKPLDIGEISDTFGRTPGHDVGYLRHPDTSHDFGLNADIAYYQKNGDNKMRTVCEADGTTSHEDAFCSSSARETHIVDLDRTTYFIAMLLRSDQVRVIGVDPQIGSLIEETASSLVSRGYLNDSDVEHIKSVRLIWGPGWPYHHHHLHVSLNP